MSEALFRLKGIKKTYKKGAGNELQVLRGVDLELAAGEIVALVAPSGAGKSTLLHIAGLLDNPDEGEVCLGGNSLGSKGDRRRTLARRQNIGFVYQAHHLLPEFTALENVTLPQLANGISNRTATEHAKNLLTKVGLSDRADHRPAELSGGEQQRVAFCRALANQPQLLLADEPTGNLDPATSSAVFDVLTGLVRETGMSALIATHNAELAGRMDRILRLEGGVLI